MKKIIKLTENDLVRLVKQVIKEQDNLSDYSKNEFEDALQNLSYQKPPRFQDVDMSSENFDEAYDEIKGKTFASFGDMGMYVDIYKDYPASDVANSLLKKFPVVEIISSYEEWKESKYFKHSLLFNPNTRMKIPEVRVRASFNDYKDKYGDMIIKKGENIGSPSLNYSVNPESQDMSPEERSRHLQRNIDRQMR